MYVIVESISLAEIFWRYWCGSCWSYSLSSSKTYWSRGEAAREISRIYDAATIVEKMVAEHRENLGANFIGRHTV